MPDSPLFLGFSEPEENWYRLPNDWFGIWHVVRNEHGSRFVPMLKMTEYVLKHTWGAGKFNGRVQLSADEIRSGRRRNKSARFDHGTGISPNSVQSAGKTLAKLGLLEIEQDQNDLARHKFAFFSIFNLSEYFFYHLEVDMNQTDTYLDLPVRLLKETEIAD